MGTDFALIRLKPSFAEAKHLYDPKVSDPNLRRHSFIQLLPKGEPYLQITNLSTGIAFDNDYQVLIVDCYDRQLAEVTANVGIFEFTDSYGVQQISFELANLNVNFYGNKVFFKFIHTAGSDVWYSNPVLITSHRKEETTRFDYTASGLFNGVDYDRSENKFQSIRLKCFYDRPVNRSESKGYDQITTNNAITAQKHIYRYSAYKIQYLTPFTINSVEVLLSHDIIYIDGERCTDKPDLNYDERLGNSNLFIGDFKASINSNDTFAPTWQIIEPLHIVSKAPDGIYTSGTFPAQITASFNKAIILGTGTLTVYNSDDTILETFTQNDITVAGNSFSIDFDAPENGDYYIKISNGVFSSGVEMFAGISNTTDWIFAIGEGFYSETYYNENNYLI